MSNALAIAAVTAVLRDRLNDGLINADLGSLGGVTVTSLPPDRFGPGGTDETPANRLNLFLYRVSVNTGWANERLPSRAGDGTRTTNPYLALDLHYLLSAYGLEDLNDQILLGYGMQILHETPILGRDAVRTSLGSGAVNGTVLPAAFQQLSAADLAEQVEQIRVTPHYADLETTSQLWSSLNTGLRPTALYVATVVLVESRAPTKTALPVREGRLHVPLLRRPTITRLLSQPDAQTPPSEGRAIVHGDRLVLLGSGLKGDLTRARIGAVTVEDADVEATATRLAFPLPADLLPGVHGVQVIHEIPKEDSNETIPTDLSNLKAFVLSPSFVPGPDPAPLSLEGTALVDADDPAGPVDATVRVRFAHDVGARQPARLLLDELVTPGESAGSYGFESTPLAEGVATATELELPIRGVAQGNYLVRLRIDGAESPLETTDGAYSGPTLEVTAP